MERSHSTTIALILWLWGLAPTAIVMAAFARLVSPASPAQAQAPNPAPAASPRLTVTLTLEHNTIAQPFPARVTLHLHNAGPDTLWLYRHVRDPADLAEAQRRAARSTERSGSWSTGGSSLIVHLEPAALPGSQAESWTEPPGGKVMASVGMPHPRLVKLAPGGDDTEGAVVALDPALVPHGGSSLPLWGRYHFSVVYKAAYSNADALSRDLGVDIWQGEAISNTTDVDLEPAPAFASGSISGQVMDPNGRVLPGMLVSLSDSQSHVIGQIITGVDANFAFGHLPFGTYWATVRQPQATDQTAAYDHAELAADSPKATVNLVPIETEVYEPKQLWHKPVLLRVMSSAGAPLAGVAVEALYTSGTVADTVKGETDSDGTVTLNLIPGRNYVTLKHHKCANQDVRVDVAEGDGIDASSLQYDCNPR